MINRGGEKVPVGDVEQLLYAHPAVAEVAIVAMPDPRLGERACAFVVLAPDTELSFTQMQAHLDAGRPRQALLARAAGDRLRAAAHAVGQDPEIHPARPRAQLHRRAERGPMTTATPTAPIDSAELAQLTEEIRTYVRT